MKNIRVYKRKGHRVKIEQTKLHREWMDDTNDRHAYKCFPLSLANTIGYSISFLDDIEFIWDGIIDHTEDHVKIIRSGHNICNLARGNATISFNTELWFETDENTSLLSIAPPNYFFDGVVPYTNLISSSFYQYPLPVAWRITRPNENIIIPAETPVITVIPISLKQLVDTELNIYDKQNDPNEKIDNDEKLKKIMDMYNNGQPHTNFYRDAVNYKGEKIGNHELKNIKLSINDFTTKDEKNV
jgi:hypothetical protein